MAFHNAMPPPPPPTYVQQPAGFEGFQRNELRACIAVVKVMNGKSEAFSSQDMRARVTSMLGAPIYDVRMEGGSTNAANLWTIAIYLADREGERVNKSQDFVDVI